MRKRGKPVTHQKVKHVETGNVFKTYLEAGESIGGSRHGVRRCCEGTQKHHHHNHFVWIDERSNDNGKSNENNS